MAETTISIARSVDDVYAFLADPGNDPSWCTRVRSVERSGDGEYRVMHKPLRIQPRARDENHRHGGFRSSRRATRPHALGRQSPPYARKTAPKSR